MKGKRIVFVANTAWSMYNFRLNLLNLLIHQGAEVIVLAPYDDYADRFAGLGIGFRSISKLKAQGANPIDDVLLYLEFKRIFRDIAPDMVFTYTIKPNIYGILAANRLNIPAVAVVTGLGHGISKGGIITAIIKRLYKTSLSRTVKTWFLNRDDCAYFVNERIAKSEKTQVIPGEGVDMECFNRKNTYPDHEPVQFLYVGRLLYEKGVGEFVEAINRLKERGLKVKGELLGFTDTLNPTAVTLSTVKAWDESGIIDYLGKTDDVRPYLEQVHCLVFPSYYSEGIPRCLLEAASMEIPAITTDHVGCRDVVADGETGYLCQPKDVDSLFEQMLRFMELPAHEKKAMGQKARQLVARQFSETVVFDAYIRQITDIFVHRSRS